MSQNWFLQSLSSLRPLALSPPTVHIILILQQSTSCTRLNKNNTEGKIQTVVKKKKKLQTPKTFYEFIHNSSFFSVCLGWQVLLLSWRLPTCTQCNTGCTPHITSAWALLKSWTNWEISPKSSWESWSAGWPNFSWRVEKQKKIQKNTEIYYLWG